MSKNKHGVYFIIQSNDGQPEDVVAYPTYAAAEQAAKERYSDNGKNPVQIFQSVAVVGLVSDDVPVTKITKARAPKKVKSENTTDGTE